MTDSMLIFDRALVRRHRDRAAGIAGDHGFLFAEVAERLADRLDDVRRRFGRVLDLGCHDGVMARVLKGRAGEDLLVSADLSPAMARLAPPPSVTADEEALPFAPGSFDLITSCLSLHWVNDLPGALIQIRRCLKPDGLFLAALLGGETLHELRVSLMEAEIARAGGASPRVSPFADLRDMAGLLQRAGFALPVADVDTLTVAYETPMALLADLRAMGETNAVRARRRAPDGKALFADALDRYGARFAEPDGRAAATFQVIYLIGWAPDPSQPQPLRPGSAAVRLADALGTAERDAGETAKPGKPRA